MKTMKLMVIVKPELNLIKEEITYRYGEIFEVSEERGIEILKTTFNGKPVVEYVPVDSDKELEDKNLEISKLTEENSNLTNHIEELELKVKELTEENEKLLETLTSSENTEKTLQKNDKNKKEEK